MSEIDLHLVSWNRPKMTELVIRTIARNTRKDHYRLSVLDNGSSQSTHDMLIGLKREGLIYSVILWDENHGLEAARHQLYLYNTGSAYFVDIDNDCLPPPLWLDGSDWLDHQLDIMQQFEDYAALSQRTQVMIGTGNIFEEADQDDADVLEFPHPGGSFRLMRTDAVNHTNGWDRAAGGRGSEERYICGRLHDEGYKTGFAPKIRCLHLFGTRDTGNETDRWGYDKTMQPQDSGHSDIWHPALSNGDNQPEVAKYAGPQLAEEYFR